MWGAARGIAFVVGLTALFLPAGAAATVTIGSNLGREPAFAESCAPSCTLVPDTLPSDSVAPGGITSPVNGTVVAWHIRVGLNSNPTTFRVVGRRPGGFATGVGTSATVTPPVNATTSFPANLPISIGQSIGIDCCNAGGEDVLVQNNGTTALWLPVLPNGGAPQEDFFSSPINHEVAVNADIEPISTFTVSAVKFGKGGKTTVTTILPNAGTLTGGQVGTPNKKHLLVKPASATAAVVNQTIRLLLKPAKRARALLHEKTKLKAKLAVVFTPTGGSPSTQILRVKLKR